MKVTRDVITDLLPVYLAGDASADTRNLVEAYLAQDPTLAKAARESARPMALASSTPPLDPDVELRALTRTRRLLRMRGLLMAVALFLSFLPLTFVAADGNMRWAWSKSPGTAMVIAVIAAFAWAAYFWLRRSLRSTQV
jgi:hypothetical protein